MWINSNVKFYQLWKSRISTTLPKINKFTPHSWTTPLGWSILGECDILKLKFENFIIRYTKVFLGVKQMKTTLKFKYKFPENFNPTYTNGVYGGIAPQGEIVMNFFFWTTPTTLCRKPRIRWRRPSCNTTNCYWP